MVETRTTAMQINASMRRGKNRPATVAELSQRTHAREDTTRRVVNRMIKRGIMEHAGVRKCKVKGTDLYTYKLV